jgi:hypothetical protein
MEPLAKLVQLHSALFNKRDQVTWRTAVGNESKRIHVLLPADILDEIDRRVGARRRSQLEALDEFAGYLKDVDIPGWETPETAAEWVRQQRRLGSDPWDEVDQFSRDP